MQRNWNGKEKWPAFLKISLADLNFLFLLSSVYSLLVFGMDFSVLVDGAIGVGIGVVIL